MRDPYLQPARRIALIYVVLGGLWILFSDQAALWLFQDIQLLNWAQTLKGWFYVLASGALIYWLMRRSLIRLKAIAMEDHLTKLPNRHAFDTELSRRCKAGKAKGQTFYLTILDIDNFKELNEELGHSEGDDLLIALTRQLKKKLGESWYIARLGGDEFGLISPSALSDEDCRTQLNRWQRSLTEDDPYPLLQEQTLSFGSCRFPDDGKNAQDLLRHTDMAVFYAKQHGRNQHCLFHAELKDRLMKRLSLTKDLRHACENEAFELVYQPQWSVSRRRWTGAEVLLRWNHPVEGYISPSEFIPLAEEQGLIGTITLLVLRQSLFEVSKAGIDQNLLLRLSIPKTKVILSYYATV